MQVLFVFFLFCLIMHKTFAYIYAYPRVDFVLYFTICVCKDEFCFLNDFCLWIWIERSQTKHWQNNNNKKQVLRSKNDCKINVNLYVGQRKWIMKSVRRLQYRENESSIIATGCVLFKTSWKCQCRLWFFFSCFNIAAIITSP